MFLLPFKGSSDEERSSVSPLLEAQLATEVKEVNRIHWKTFCIVLQFLTIIIFINLTNGPANLLAIEKFITKNT
jgi:hypothetical protein